MDKPDTGQSIHNTERVADTRMKTDRRNNRLVVMDRKKVSNDVPEQIFRYAKERGLEKIIITCHDYNNAVFESAGFSRRAVVNGFFKGEDGYFLTAFTDRKREVSDNLEKEDRIIDKCMEKKPVQNLRKKDYTMIECGESDIPQMIDLFETVFETYPTKVFDADYLKKVMKERIHFMAIVEDGKIISIASADMDRENLNAEITDCATYPEHRGRGMLSVLIPSLEDELRKRGFITAYTLARAIHTGVNMVFRKLGYDYNGRLINNCNICGKYEDMNIWSKTL